MPIPVHVPRLNANDDVLTVVRSRVSRGDRVSAGDVLLDLESSKTVSEIEAPSDGYILEIHAAAGDSVAVGSTICWLGVDPSEPVPRSESNATDGAAAARESKPTLKALEAMLAHGVDASTVPHQGPRITEADVLNYVAAAALDGRGSRTGLASGVGQAGPDRLQQAMARTVRWHAEQAVPAYLEVAFDQALWVDSAKRYAQEHGLIFDPLLGLIAHRLVRTINTRPRANSYMEDGLIHTHMDVRLGFMVEVKGSLYMVVVPDAARLERGEFLKKLAALQLAAYRQKLKEADVSGATVAFTSLAKYGVLRHIPVLAPRTSLIVAHASAPLEGERAVLGCTYDHRLLHGVEAAAILNEMAHPE